MQKHLCLDFGHLWQPVGRVVAAQGPLCRVCGLFTDCLRHLHHAIVHDNPATKTLLSSRCSSQGTTRCRNSMSMHIAAASVAHLGTDACLLDSCSIRVPSGRQLTRVAPAHALHSPSALCRSAASVEGSCSPSSSSSCCSMPTQASSRWSCGRPRMSRAASRNKCLQKQLREVGFWFAACRCGELPVTSSFSICSECPTCGCLCAAGQNSISIASAHPNICRWRHQHVQC